MQAATPKASALLAEFAKLFGPRWQTDVANPLDLGVRTIRRYVSGGAPVSYAAYEDTQDDGRMRVRAVQKPLDAMKAGA